MLPVLTLSDENPECTAVMRVNTRLVDVLFQIV